MSTPLAVGTSLLGDRDNVDQVRAVIGIELAHKLCSDDWAERQAGMWGIAHAITTGKLPLPLSSVKPSKPSPPLWEVVLSIVKSGLLDPSSHVSMAVHDVIIALTPDVELYSRQRASIVPWDSYDVQPALSSFVKTLMSKLGDVRRRAAESNRLMLVRLAQCHAVVFNVVCKALFTPPTAPGGMSSPSDSACRLMSSLCGRLRVLHDLILCPLVEACELRIPFAACLKFITSSLKSPSMTVYQLARNCAESLLLSPAADATDNVGHVQEFLSTCDEATRTYFDDLMMSSTGTPVDLGLAGIGINSRSQPPSHSLRMRGGSLGDEDTFEGLGITSIRIPPRSPSPASMGAEIGSPARPSRNLTSLPPGSPIVTPSGPDILGPQSPLRYTTRTVGSAGMTRDGPGIALTGEVASLRRAPLAGRRATSAKVSRTVFVID